MQDIISLITLGCAKNTVDSEIVKSRFLSSGYLWTEDHAEATIIMINTCGFIKDAKEESIETILTFAKNKRKNQRIVVFGCLAQRYAQEIYDEIPEVDAIFGNDLLQDMPLLLRQLEGSKRILQVKTLKEFQREPFLERDNIEDTYYSYLKIADGCDNYCSYCVIPLVRGDYRSKKLDEVLNEARYLAEKGSREIILIAQDIGAYGKDLNPCITLATLLRELVKIPDICWIRLLYCYPNRVSDDLLELIASEDKICNYIDIPLQHLSDSVIKNMGRTITYEQINALIARCRQKVPGIVLRSTFIIGFPGESDLDFQVLCTRLKELQFDQAAFFAYSLEEGTPAADYPMQVDKETVEKRLSTVVNIQKNITVSNLKKHVGHTLPIIIEEKIPSEDDWYLGRCYIQAPDIDGQTQIRISTTKNDYLGKICKAKIIGSANIDLIGEIIDEPCE